MKVHFKFEITDDHRQLVASYIRGRTVRAMATRKELCEFLQGCLDAAIEDYSYASNDEAAASGKPVVSPVAEVNLSPEERQTVERLRAQGRDDSYIRGWLTVGRGAGAPRPKF